MFRRFAIMLLILVIQIPLVISGCRSKEDINSESSRHIEGTYIGTALRGETDCMSNGSCFFCTATDTVQVVRKNGQVTIDATGPSLSFTPCKTGSTGPMPTLKGTYTSFQDSYATFEVNWCNGGKGTAAGGGVIEGNTMKASFSCETVEHGSNKIEWNDVVLTKQ